MLEVDDVETRTHEQCSALNKVDFLPVDTSCVANMCYIIAL